MPLGYSGRNRAHPIPSGVQKESRSPSALRELAPSTRHRWKSVATDANRARPKAQFWATGNHAVVAAQLPSSLRPSSDLELGSAM